MIKNLKCAFSMQIWSKARKSNILFYEIMKANHTTFKCCWRGFIGMIISFTQSSVTSWNYILTCFHYDQVRKQNLQVRSVKFLCGWIKCFIASVRSCPMDRICIKFHHIRRKVVKRNSSTSFPFFLYIIFCSWITQGKFILMSKYESKFWKRLKLRK